MKFFNKKITTVQLQKIRSKYVLPIKTYIMVGNKNGTNIT